MSNGAAPLIASRLAFATWSRPFRISRSSSIGRSARTSTPHQLARATKPGGSGDGQSRVIRLSRPFRLARIRRGGYLGAHQYRW